MLSLIEFESYKLETNQKNISAFEMPSYFEDILFISGSKESKRSALRWPVSLIPACLL